MPLKADRICTCGKRVPYRTKCICNIVRRREYDDRRPTSTQRGYDGKWTKARAIFLLNNPLCAMCGKPAKVVDHIKPHRGDKTIFWARTNWQSLCLHHHNSTKQSIERKAARR